MNVVLGNFHRLKPAERSDTSQKPSSPTSVSLIFHPPHISAAQLLQTVLWILISAAIVAAAWISQESQQLAEEAAQYERAAERLRQQNSQVAELLRQDGLILTPQQLSDLKREVTFANQLSEKRDFSWSRLLSALEEVLPQKVSLISIRMDFRESVLFLRGIAASHREVTDLVAQLEKHELFQKATLSDHHALARTSAGQDSAGALSMTEGGRQSLVEFALTVVYRPVF